MQSYERSPKNESNLPDDPKARGILREANEGTYRWPIGFGGFEADLSYEEAGRIAKGRVHLVPPRQLAVSLDDQDLQKWAEGQIGMMAIHRSARPFDQSDGKYSLTLGEPDHHPLGQIIHIHGDGMNSHYRIHNGRITQINRAMEKIHFTINVDDSLITKDGKFLTTRYTVYYFSPKDRSLANVESYMDRHTTLDEVYLPGLRRINSVDHQRVVTRSLQFSNHRLL